MTDTEKIKAALKGIDREYETEYDGQTYTICSSCHKQDDQPHKASCAWKDIDAALSNPLIEGGGAERNTVLEEEIRLVIVSLRNGMAEADEAGQSWFSIHKRTAQKIIRALTPGDTK